jgi:uncharacterized LabA/DUF88 family protein
MVIKHKDQRVGVFIDAQNLYHSAKHLYHKKVNFAEILKTAVADRKLIRAVAYVIASDSEEEKGFFDALVKTGIETKIKDLQVFSGGAKKADWDVGLAVDAIKMAHKLDTVVIVSGDGDFTPLVEYLKLSGCQVEALAFGRSTSAKLKEIVEEFVDMDHDPRRYLMQTRGGSFTPAQMSQIQQARDNRADGRAPHGAPQKGQVTPAAAQPSAPKAEAVGNRAPAAGGRPAGQAPSRRGRGRRGPRDGAARRDGERRSDSEQRPPANR